MHRSPDDQTYDAERIAKREDRIRLAAKRRVTLAQVEDAIASVAGASSMDRRTERERLIASRARLGW